MNKPGLWLAPLDAEQVKEAVEFGKLHFADPRNLDDLNLNPYGVWVPRGSVALTFITAFGNIAGYAGQRAAQGLEISDGMVASINSIDYYRAGFLVQACSPHPRPIVAGVDLRSDQGEWVLNRDFTQAGPRQHISMTTFMAPEPLDEIKHFVVSVPMGCLVGEQMSGFEFDFGKIH